MSNDITNNNSDIEFIKKRFLEWENKFTKLEEKMDKILEILEKDCKKMTDHIDFVENVYENVKMPFNLVMNEVKYLFSSSSSSSRNDIKCLSNINDNSSKNDFNIKLN